MIDKDAFCELIRQHEKAMYSLAYSVVGNVTDAEDVISEAIFRAYRFVDNLKDVNAFKAWILRIVHNCAIEHIRKNAKTVSIDEIEVEAEKESHENSLVTTLSLREAIERLDQPYRTVVTLFYFEDLSIARIAKITGTTPVTAKKRLSRARKQLYAILKED